MLLKKITKNGEISYYIISMSNFWSNLMVESIDYSTNIPPKLLNNILLNVLDEGETQTENFIILGLYIKNHKMNISIKKNMDTIYINIIEVAKESNINTFENPTTSLDKLPKICPVKPQQYEQNNYQNNGNNNFIRYNYEIDELIKKVFIEENSINSRVIKLENSFKEVEEALKEIEDNFLVTRIDALKGFKRGDWKIIGTFLFILTVVFYQITHIEKVEFIFEKIIPLDLNSQPKQED
jgi:hypothetical protein